ncbi:MAG: DUF5110 domain-containing protein [Acidobacteriota bacterium]|nr:DUF5110 domain-containing protein [Acidobacteriota bacterium]
MVNVVTKSGTNSFHGDAYEFYRNQSLDANLWFADHDNVPIAKLSRNQFGVSAGGPLYIPKIYKQREKTFLFGLYEHYQVTTPSIATYTVPDSNFLNGNFSELLGSQPTGRDDQEPWVGGPAQEAIRRRFIEERYRLMPYLYTLAEESSRAGLPMIRPLFLEYPNAAPDRHPIDTDIQASGECLLGHDLQIAPSPFPNEADSYSIEFPSADRNNYWTGEKVGNPGVADPDPGQALSASAQVQLSIPVKPDLATLPVFVHAGSILPIAPLVQSANQTPQGPWSLRAHAGDDCNGRLYQDDGRTYAYKDGAYLRMKFTCQIASAGFHLRASPPEGTYPAWWKEIRVEIYGWTPSANTGSLNGEPLQSTVSPIDHGFAITIPARPENFELQLRSQVSRTPANPHIPCVF